MQEMTECLLTDMDVEGTVKKPHFSVSPIRMSAPDGDCPEQNRPDSGPGPITPSNDRLKSSSKNETHHLPTDQSE